MKSDLIDITGVLRAETGKAVQIDHGGKAPCWLPRSQVEIAANADGRTVTVTMPEWLAMEKEII